MNNAIQVFNYEGCRVRTVDINGEAWFIAADVCRVLGIKNARDAVNALDDDEKMTVDNSDGHSGKRGGAQSYNVISEPGLYALILRSNKPEAKRFARWVRNEVLPAIHHTGGYQSALPRISEAEIALRRKELDIQTANLLQHMIDTPAFPLSEESKAVIQHETFKILTGHECLSMLPALTERWYSAEDIGAKLGISACKVGRIANQHNLKPPKGESNQYGRWIVSKSRYSSKECPQFIYSQEGMDWFTNYRDGILA